MHMECPAELALSLTRRVCGLLLCQTAADWRVVTLFFAPAGRRGFSTGFSISLGHPFHTQDSESAALRQHGDRFVAGAGQLDRTLTGGTRQGCGQGRDKTVTVASW